MRKTAGIFFKVQKFKSLKMTTIKRILVSGVLHFWRNGWLSTATVSIMSLALSVILGLLIVSVLTESLILNFQNKIDVSAYFKQEIAEEEILSARNDLLAQKEVKNVEYISKDKALENFKEEYKDNQDILESLRVLDSNPLEASLNIKAKSADQFPAIVSFLEGKKYQDQISKVSYYENKETIQQLTSVISAIRKVGFTLSLALALIAVLISFNTIRITIYTLRDEISIMKLVGASNWFVRGPFIAEGVLHGVISSFATMLLFYPIIFLVSPYTEEFFPGSRLSQYYQENFLQLWLILMFFGIVLGVFGSMIAIRKHLKI